MSTTIRHVLQNKGVEVATVRPESTVLDALRLMAERDIGAVLITENEQLMGIFTERDYARKVALKGRTSATTAVRELMTPNVCTITPLHTIEEVMSVMTENRFRHLPVVEHGRLCGIVTIGDMVKATIAQQKMTIEQLSSYISGDIR